jgi:hypothetical protein
MIRMAKVRPPRVYYDQKKDKYYFLLASGKRKYIKVPNKTTAKQLVKNVINNYVYSAPTRRRTSKRQAGPSAAAVRVQSQMSDLYNLIRHQQMEALRATLVPAEKKKEEEKKEEKKAEAPPPARARSDPESKEQSDDGSEGDLVLDEDIVEFANRLPPARQLTYETPDPPPARAAADPPARTLAAEAEPAGRAGPAEPPLSPRRRVAMDEKDAHGIAPLPTKLGRHLDNYMNIIAEPRVLYNNTKTRTAFVYDPAKIPADEREYLFRHFGEAVNILLNEKVQQLESEAANLKIRPNMDRTRKAWVVLLAKPGLVRQLVREPGAPSAVREALSRMFSSKKGERQGSGNPLSSGLYDYQITNILKDSPNFVGTICIDEMGRLPLKRKMSWVMNLTPSYVSNTHPEFDHHWVACYLDAEDSEPSERSMMYYDSFAEPPPKRFFKDIKHLLVDRLKLPFYVKMKIHRGKPNQRVNSNSCGMHAITFIQDIDEGKTFQEASHFDSIPEAEKEMREKENQVVKKFGYV